jgi:hypothetical protein
MPDPTCWREVLPRPPTYGFNLPLNSAHVEILMRCVERYDFNRFRRDDATDG